MMPACPSAVVPTCHRRQGAASFVQRSLCLVGACGWKLRPGAPVQGPGQPFRSLTSLPALGFPGFSELKLTVPGSQPHAATDPDWTVDRADRGPPDRIELLQRVRGPCHARIILSASTSGKASRPPWDLAPIRLSGRGWSDCGCWIGGWRMDGEVGQRLGGQ
jgi:hypothetical protein